MNYAVQIELIFIKMTKIKPFYFSLSHFVFGKFEKKGPFRAFCFENQKSPPQKKTTKNNTINKYIHVGM